MRKKEIKCPYCGSKAKLVHFYDIYGKDATHPERYAWACARFPQCDSYVSTIKGSTKPAGTLADFGHSGGISDRADVYGIRVCVCACKGKPNEEKGDHCG